jgi:hypothetical protein
MASHAEQKEAKPAYATKLEAAYGRPSQAGFGSAVFYEPPAAETTARRRSWPFSWIDGAG